MVDGERLSPVVRGGGPAVPLDIRLHCILGWIAQQDGKYQVSADTWEFTGAWFYFLRANAKCNLHLWWENTCWATGWPCVSIAALWLEVLHVQYVKLILLIYRLFSKFDPTRRPCQRCGMVQRQQAGSLVSFSASLISLLVCLGGRFFFDSRHYFFDFGPNFGYHFCPYFWGGATKERNWRPLKTGAKIVPQIGLKIQPKNLIQKLETNQCRHQRRRDRSCLLSLDHCKSLAKSPGVGSNFKNDRLKKERMEHIANERVQSSNKGAF